MSRCPATAAESLDPIGTPMPLSQPMLAGLLVTRFGPWFDALLRDLRHRNELRPGPRPPSAPSGVLAQLERLRTDDDLREYVHRRASAEDVKVILLGFHTMCARLRNQSETPLAKYLGETPDLMRTCRAAAMCWAGSRERHTTDRATDARTNDESR